MNTKNQLEEINTGEKAIRQLYAMMELTPLEAADYEGDSIELFRDLHEEYAMKGFLGNLSWGYQRIDSGQPWILFWMLNVLSTLEVEEEKLQLHASISKKIVKYLQLLQNEEEGGFAGTGDCQSHVASTYAGVLALALVGTEEAYSLVDRQKMKKFLLLMKGGQQNAKVEAQFPSSKRMIAARGAFHLHYNGEIDMRGVYCALVISHLLALDQDTAFYEQLTEGIVEFISSCQSYQGGFSCEPFGQAHGGYTYCSMASLVILNRFDIVNLDRVLEWLSNRQHPEFGGFNGRINKLVDGCYNHWQGDSFALLHQALTDKGGASYQNQYLYDQLALQFFGLVCCQDSKGGLMDKPGARADMYHTNYSLTGISAAMKRPDGSSIILGDDTSLKLKQVDPVFNIPAESVQKMRQFLSQK